MVLNYRFKKERLDNGHYVSRPRIPITLHGPNGSLNLICLIDSGCDTTVIPGDLANAVGLELEGKKNKLFGYRDVTEVTESKANITILGKEPRQNVTLFDLPVLITIPSEAGDEMDMVLGTDGFFDKFEITFKKAKNQIILKPLNPPY